MNFRKMTSYTLKSIFFILIYALAFSCIPLQIAPNIEGAKVYKGKKFKRKLPKQYVYVFEDPKDANEFYTYINAKYKIDYDEGGGNVPITINQKKYYLTFYEVERNTQTVNLIPMIVDAALENKGNTAILEDIHYSRVGTWYIALTVTDDKLNDNLKETEPNLKSILKYLDQLRSEYLTTANYRELYFKTSSF